MKRLRMLSLCAGIGGFDLAAEWAGMEIVGQVEIDPFCLRVLAKHWPHVRRGHWDAGGFVTVVGDIGSYVGPEAMGIDWMTGQELSQAIPPAYGEFVGRQMLAAIGASS